MKLPSADLSGMQIEKPKMRIAQVSPLIESVPPKGYGGTERVVSYLTEELVARGHEVTLFASADSTTRATLVPVIPGSIRSRGEETFLSAYSTVQMGLVAELSSDFDIIHFHTGYTHFPTAKFVQPAHLTTLHDRQDLAELELVYRHYPAMPLVSISDSQRAPHPELNWIGTVHHGLPDDLYSYCAAPQDYFVFIGRISPDKRVDRAIEIAEHCGAMLYIGAVVENKYQDYFEHEIKPLFDKSCVRFLGEVNQQEKRELLENAQALLFPIDWPEPFGLVMIEALACGTPVIAYRNGATREIVDHGVTGFLVSNQEEAIEAAKHVSEIDRRQCRAAFEQRFTASVMAEKYERIYQKLLSPVYTAPINVGAGDGR